MESGCVDGAEGIQASTAGEALLRSMSGPLFQPPPADRSTWRAGEKALCAKTEAETGRKTFEELCQEYEFDFGLFDEPEQFPAGWEVLYSSYAGGV